MNNRNWIRSMFFGLAGGLLVAVGMPLLWAASGGEVPIHSFVPNTVISASEMNENFVDLTRRLAALEVAAGPAHGPCPAGYVQILDDSAFNDATSATRGACLCRRGADEVVCVGDFWVDRFELTLVDATTYATGKCDGPGEPPDPSVQSYHNRGFSENGSWVTPLFACSRSGLTPSHAFNWFQAAQACSLAGKHLISNAEWQTAAAGTDDPTGSSVGVGGLCVTSGGQTRVNGTGTLCQSAYGAQDMIGNYWEWVSDWGQYGNTFFGSDQDYLVAHYPWSPTWSGDGNPGACYGVNGIVASSKDVFQAGSPAAVLRGGDSTSEQDAGQLATLAGVGPGYVHAYFGGRCALRR